MGIITTGHALLLHRHRRIIGTLDDDSLVCKENAMDLHERLKHIRALQKTNTEDMPAMTPAGASSVTESRHPPLEALVQGVWRERQGCRCLLRERVLPLTHRHGDLPLSALLDIPSDIWIPFVAGGDGAAIDPRDLLFLDIETTGLARGAGTYAFLVGLGSFVDDAFCVRQYLMPDYDSEVALLSLLDDELAECSGLVTFNGRTFDWPILQARYVLAQHPVPFPGEPHLDLLTLARRLWRRMLPSCALSSLEVDLLAVQREGEDVPGYLIPALYHDFVRYGRTRPMAGVFYHNLVDLLSMVTLAARAGALLTDPEAQEVQAYCDDLALGRLWERLGDVDAAIVAYRRAGDMAAEPLALLLKRLGRYQEAMAVWRARLGCGEIYPYVELAKQYEHRLRDLEGARAIVLAAMAQLSQMSDSSQRRAWRCDLQHRLARLERRLDSS
jgi:uncharacterized protein